MSSQPDEILVDARGPLEIPASWGRQLVQGLPGLVLVIGAPDAGKTTLARYIYRQLRRSGCQAAYLDGDPGQQSLGPPGTMAMTLAGGAPWRRFVGATTPQRHMLPVLVGAARLVEVARAAGAETILYDTSGLVNPASGGVALKTAKIELLQPETVLALQRSGELEPILGSLRRMAGLRLVELPPAKAAVQRDPATRRAHRQAQYRGYFHGARPRVVEWEALAVLPGADFRFNQLVSLEDAAGFVRGLGIVLAADLRARRVTLYTPLASAGGIAALRLGDLTVTPGTFVDQPLPP